MSGQSEALAQQPEEVAPKQPAETQAVQMSVPSRASFAARLYSRFRLLSIAFAVVQLGVLALNTSSRLSNVGRSLVTIGFFMLLLNVGIVSAAGWTVLSPRMKQGLVVLVGATLIAFLMWLVGDATDRTPTGVMVVIIMLSAAAWVGVLWLMGRLARDAEAVARTLVSRVQRAEAQHLPGGPGDGGDSCGQCILKMLKPMEQQRSFAEPSAAELRKTPQGQVSANADDSGSGYPRQMMFAPQPQAQPVMYAPQTPSMMYAPQTPSMMYAPQPPSMMYAPQPPSMMYAPQAPQPMMFAPQPQSMMFIPHVPRSQA
jgi:hypothetical protein